MITIFNGVCDYGLVIAELLTRLGYECEILTSKCIDSSVLGQFEHVSSSQIKLCDDKNVTQAIKRSNLFINVSSGVVDCLGIKKTLYCLLIKRIPLINIPTGSDLSEIDINHMMRKYILLFIFKLGTTHLPHYQQCISVADKYDLKNFFFSRHPYLLSEKIGAKNSNDNIVFFHPSNLDWGETDNKPGRNSFKNNHLFLNAFIKAAKTLENTTSIVCHILDRGPDRHVAKSIISENDADRFFKWFPATNTVGLLEHFADADVVVDQFHLGIFGMTSMEAMAQAKPVMIYIDKNASRLVYDESPPAINCACEQEVYNSIIAWADKDKLSDLGANAEQWVRKNHDVHNADFSELIVRICMLAKLSHNVKKEVQ